MDLPERKCERMLKTYCKTGRRHVEEGRPCQDRYAAVLAGEGFLMAVADGHGGQPYVRSGLGARMACRAAVSVFQGDDREYQKYGHLIKKKFDAYIRKHLECRPLSEQEKLKLGGNPPEYAYGTTLSVVYMTDHETFVLHIGDGDLHVMDSKGEFFPPLPEDPCCVGGATSSLVTEDAESYIRTALYQDRASCAVLYSDGYETERIRPWEIIEMIATRPSEPEMEQIFLRGDRRGDDQTVLFYYDEKLTQSDKFKAGFERERIRLSLLQEEENLRRRYSELKAYLTDAVNIARQKNGMEKQVFLRKIEPRYQEYLQIQDRLTEIRDLLDRRM